MRHRPLFADGFMKSVGQKYRPANGTEGDMFRARWCDLCTRDMYVEQTGGCPTWMAALVYDRDDDDYPSELHFDDRGQPCCSDFDPIIPEAS